MSQKEEYDISEVPRDADALPPSVRVRNKKDDGWYEYDGELLFSEARILDLRDRYQEMEESDWERVATVRTRPDTCRVKIRTQDAEECQQALDDRADEVNEEFGFIFQKSSLVGIHHGIHEEGPRKSVAWADYATGRHAGLGGADYKSDQLLAPVRAFEQYVFHNRVWLPVVEEFNERYPY